MLRVNAIHEDVSFSPAMTKAVRKEIDGLANWLAGRGPVMKVRLHSDYFERKDA